MAFDHRIMGQHFVGAIAKGGQRIGGKSEPVQAVDRLHLAVCQWRGQVAPRIGKKFQRPRFGDVRVKLAQGSGGCVSGVGKWFAASRALPVVQRRKICMAHIDFAAHLDHVRRIRDLVGNIGNGPGIGRHVFARLTVATRCRLNKYAAFIPQ